jgi:hypothetical protein
LRVRHSSSTFRFVSSRPPSNTPWPTRTWALGDRHDVQVQPSSVQRGPVRTWRTKATPVSMAAAPSCTGVLAMEAASRRAATTEPQSAAATIEPVRECAVAPYPQAQPVQCGCAARGRTQQRVDLNVARAGEQGHRKREIHLHALLSPVRERPHQRVADRGDDSRLSATLASASSDSPATDAPATEARRRSPAGCRASAARGCRRPGGTPRARPCAAPSRRRARSRRRACRTPFSSTDGQAIMASAAVPCEACAKPSKYKCAKCK